MDREREKSLAYHHIRSLPESMNGCIEKIWIRETSEANKTLK